MQQKLQVKVDEMMDEFSEQWQPVMENLEVAEQAFDDVEGPPALFTCQRLLLRDTCCTPSV